MSFWRGTFGRAAELAAKSSTGKSDEDPVEQNAAKKAAFAVGAGGVVSS
jgi:hypothetical protein